MKEALIILLICVTQAYARCPSACSCNSRLISCVNKTLESVPILNSLETSPVILDFSGNNFVFINEEDFKFTKSDEVREIYLNNSEISEISPATFDYLDNLQELYLGHNYLSSVPESLIEHQDSIILLDISNNYFYGDMPIIRSRSLEVLLLANSKISNIPRKALRHLPNLKVLMLQQNNIQTLATDVFSKYTSSSINVRLSFNSWKCSCDNIQAFESLEKRNIIDSSDTYQCELETKEIINIFGIHGAVEIMSQMCDSDSVDNELQADFGERYEVRDMVHEGKKEIRNLKSKGKTDPELKDLQYSENHENKVLATSNVDQKMVDETLLPSCWERFTSNSDGFFTVVLIVTVSSFLTGFTSGVIFSKIFQILRRKKLETSSDSQVQLLRA